MNKVLQKIRAVGARARRFLKTKIVLVSLFVGTIAIYGCKKEKLPELWIEIEYMGDGGFYNDDIESVPYNLMLGLNGPFRYEPYKTYNIQYKADRDFGVATREFTPQGNHYWTIRCSKVGNRAQIVVVPGNRR